tara:strand:+ start:10574 stop:10918 length:345 start_codon:yes stop_codon:yes gene_type:complete
VIQPVAEVGVAKHFDGFRAIMVADSAGQAPDTVVWRESVITGEFDVTTSQGSYLGGINHFPQYPTGLNTRQLPMVSHYDESGPWSQTLQKVVPEQQIKHRSLIDHDNIKGQGVV